MYQEERHAAILERARNGGRVDVAELAAEFDVTPETVRRDLTSLERHGFLRRVHGGAIPVERLGFEPGLSARDQAMASEKARIAEGRARRAPRRGRDPAGCGHDHRAARGDAAGRPRVHRRHQRGADRDALSARPNVTVLTVGGRVRGRTLAMVDGWALRVLADTYVDVAFLGTNGVSVERGLTTPDVAEAAVKGAMMAAARRVVVLADHTKVGNDCFARFGDLEAVDTLDDRRRSRRPSRRRPPGGRPEGGARMIVTFTANPSVDRTLEIPELTRGAVIRATRTRVDGGGKGVNVTRALAANGHPSIAVLPSGGAEGAQLMALLEAEQLLVQPGSDRGRDPRQRHDRRAGRDDDEDQRAGSDAERGRGGSADRCAASDGAVGTDWAVLSGSLPPGAPADWYATLTAALHELGVRVAVDTDGAGLPAAFAAAPDLVKPNQRELAQASGMPVESRADALAAVHRIRAAGARTVLASLGADGALLVDDDRRLPRQRRRQRAAQHGRCGRRDARGLPGCGRVRRPGSGRSRRLGHGRRLAPREPDAGPE